MRELYRLLRAVVLLVSVGNVEIPATIPLAVHVQPAHSDQYYELTSKSFKHNGDLLRFLLKHGTKADTIDQAFVTAACHADAESLRIHLEKHPDITKVGGMP